MKWINTKVEFTWDSKEKRYKEIDVEGYHYSGPIADCGGGCFLANTKILMTDGDVKNIEDIQVGDMVLVFGQLNKGEVAANGLRIINDDTVLPLPPHKMNVQIRYEKTTTQTDLPQ